MAFTGSLVKSGAAGASLSGDGGEGPKDREGALERAISVCKFGGFLSGFEECKEVQAFLSNLPLCTLCKKPLHLVFQAESTYTSSFRRVLAAFSCFREGVGALDPQNWRLVRLLFPLRPRAIIEKNPKQPTTSASAEGKGDGAEGDGGAVLGGGGGFGEETVSVQLFGSSAVESHDPWGEKGGGEGEGKAAMEAGSVPFDDWGAGSVFGFGSVAEPQAGSLFGSSAGMGMETGIDPAVWGGDSETREGGGVDLELSRLLKLRDDSLEGFQSKEEEEEEEKEKGSKGKREVASAAKPSSSSSSSQVVNETIEGNPQTRLREESQGGKGEKKKEKGKPNFVREGGKDAQLECLPVFRLCIGPGIPEKALPSTDFFSGGSFKTAFEEEEEEEDEEEDESDDPIALRARELLEEYRQRQQQGEGGDPVDLFDEQGGNGEARKGEWGEEGYEGSGAEDRMLSRLVRRARLLPEEVLRYEFGGPPLFVGRDKVVPGSVRLLNIGNEGSVGQAGSASASSSSNAQRQKPPIDSSDRPAVGKGGMEGHAGGEKVGGTGKEIQSTEKCEGEDTRTSQKNRERIATGSSVRYSAQTEKIRQEESRCEFCGESMLFEAQLMPSLFSNAAKALGLSASFSESSVSTGWKGLFEGEWGSVLFFSCANDCGLDADESRLEEKAERSMAEQGCVLKEGKVFVQKGL
uniref:Programmed cell death protein 2 C-terminal domain-containing protein n=1 Tax=Chromera velia CCMP2878 TaxID=1169474 RepID=A0A0G4FZX0_9ALVE|eukprot:Cvel_19445.t1-p1 / transcript=Cvel_19445.t1 / gene=Cvel_19445 / organism=Chromera_velia_CCMP2878 / gene_product=hypothetical protein / transcript_product=hypothetical protein / location=Cvel_scaffold1677:19405-21704(-) / protein_length=690 / sequence_SO=supercontig / SO=protein_coding / is_pseudo=false